MENWQLALMTAIIAFITSVITSYLTLQFTYKNDVKKHILEKRTQFYLEVFPIIDKLVNCPQKVFNAPYMKKFISFKADAKLLASRKTFAAYQDLFDFVITPYNCYDIYIGHHNPKDNRADDPDVLAKIDSGDLMLSAEEFYIKYLPDRDELCDKIEVLFQAMRNDLGSNIK